MAPLKYSGAAMFRQRVVLSLLSGRPLRIDKIRQEDPEFTGIQDFEASFLRLIDAITDGTRIEVNETGTAMRLRPGVLIGGKISHDCGTSRSVGWFIEGILPLAPFTKFPLTLTLTGLTNDDVDLSVDTLQHVTLPLLQNFGIYNASLKVQRRGVPPKGGGLVELSLPIVRGSLNSVYIIDEGLIKRVRGVAFCTRVSPTIITRMIDSCRSVLNDFLPDVHISSDHYKGKEGGESPGYSLQLVAETTSGALLSVERTAKTRRARAVPGTDHLDLNLDSDRPGGEMPEDVGIEAAQMLLGEIFSGGVIDRAHQSLILTLMVLTSEDVSKVRFGQLSAQAVHTLRLLKDAFGTVFRIQEERCSADKQLADDLLRGKNLPENEEDDEVYGDFEDLEVAGSDNDEDEDEDEEAMSIDGSEEEDSEEEGSEQEGSEEGSEQEGSEGEDSPQEDSMDEEDKEIEEASEQAAKDALPERVTYLLSCLGTGYVNTNRKAT